MDWQGDCNMPFGVGLFTGVVLWRLPRCIHIQDECLGTSYVNHMYTWERLASSYIEISSGWDFASS